MAQTRMYKIYGLKVIGDTEIRYIGYTKRTLQKRLYHHMYDAKRGLTYRKCNWIRKNNFNIEIVLFENNLTYEEALEREIIWISRYDNLTNMTDGGDINPMNNPDTIKKHKEVMSKKENHKPFPKGKDNWMNSEEGKAWIKLENKRRWESGVYGNSKDHIKKYIEYDILYKVYIDENNSLAQTADILNTTYRNITRNLGRLGIKKYKKNGNKLLS